ncbi:hypothetical protein [Paralysiella testudinis]|uniref:hypothetical protein n=1 Tax=Paralysiella testudinis TaxID=2809020 RepID=UPI001E2CD98B|nr:hypothetical protein [Paralysiella testudinis]
MLTACGSTAAPSATPIKTVEVAKLPPVAAELLTAHPKPAAPASGSPQHLLAHAAVYGAWCGKQALQLQGWQVWYRSGGRDE